jgi:hypothetical protein
LASEGIGVILAIRVSIGVDFLKPIIRLQIGSCQPQSISWPRV